jgi:hypothetical protein
MGALISRYILTENLGLPTSVVLESLTELRLDIHPKSSSSLKQQKVFTETVLEQE